MKKHLAILIGLLTLRAFADTHRFTVDGSHPVGTVSPTLYGLMTEEINHAYDGGLYGELIINRAFKDDANRPINWSVVNDANSSASIALEKTEPLNEALPISLRLTVQQAAKDHAAGVANGGYWGIPAQPRTSYRASFWARAEAGFAGPVTVSIVSDDGKTVLAKGQVTGLGSQWKRFELILKTGMIAPTAQARFVLSLDHPGTVWFNLVSLFPPTWNDRPNGLRKDLMQMLVDLHPKFLRFPGGNFLEGNRIEDHFPWKKTLGPPEERPGHPGTWGYPASDGMGLLEFLEWGEDMGAEPLLAVYAGYSLNHTHVNAGPDLAPYVQDALDEIEYVTGATNTTWGARRAKAGHPAPFNLHYVEIGNEDWFDKSLSYDGRFAQFYDAIKAKYPQLKTISTTANDQPDTYRVKSRKPEMIDEHYYLSTDEFLAKSPEFAAKYDRSGPEIFVGEWAAHEDAKIRPWDAGAKQQAPTPTMKTAIGDAVFLAAMERNSDVIKMQCYAPLLVNVSPGARQWRPDLIGYDALSAYGSPSYYAIQMFSRNLGDEILRASPVGTTVQGCATRDHQTGEIFIKLVNPEPVPIELELQLQGFDRLGSKATAITLAGAPEDTNSIQHPKNVVPVTSAFSDVKPVFNYTLPPNSIVVLKLKTR